MHLPLLGHWEQLCTGPLHCTVSAHQGVAKLHFKKHCTASAYTTSKTLHCTPLLQTTCALQPLCHTGVHLRPLYRRGILDVFDHHCYLSLSTKTYEKPNTHETQIKLACIFTPILPGFNTCSPKASSLVHLSSLYTRRILDVFCFIAMRVPFKV